MEKIKFTSKDKLWFSSDSHFGHKNITYGVSDWPDKENNCRKFDTTEEMSMHIINQINKYVQEDATFFFLGDWSFGGIQNIWKYRDLINCNRIVFIPGNHDHHIINNKILPNIFWKERDDYEDAITLEDTNILVRAQELFTHTTNYMEIEVDNISVCLFHYPILEWNDRFKKSYHLHGHVHGRLEHGNGRLDVGIDNAYKLFGEYRPFSWDDVKKLLK